MVVQITFDVPPDIRAGILRGDFIRYGGVVRDTAGRLVTHLKEIPAPAKSMEQVAKPAALTLKSPWVAIGAGVITLVAVGGGIVVASKKWKKGSESAMPECVQSYNRSLRAYLDAIQNRRLNSAIIDQLITDLDAVVAHGDEGDTTVALSPDHLATITKVILDYTSKLAKANGIEMDEGDESGSDESGDGPTDAVVVSLRRYLETQKRIFAQAA